MRQALSNSHHSTAAEDALHDACLRFLEHYEGPVRRRRPALADARHQALRWRSPPAAGASAAELSATDAAGQEGELVLIARVDPCLDPAHFAERRAALAGLSPMSAPPSPSDRRLLLAEIGECRNLDLHQGQPLPLRGPQRAVGYDLLR